MDITFETFDKFGRKDFADRLTKVISTFYPFHDEAFVLSLNSSFGGGKTTFLHMWQAALTRDGYPVLYINAWETDFDDEPIVPIASALLDVVETGSASRAFRTVLNGVLGAAASVGSDILGS